MLIKILLTAGVIYIVYVAFFKQKAIQSTTTKKKDKTSEIDEMIACATCNTYCTRDDSIISLGKHYCSDACVGKDS